MIKIGIVGDIGSGKSFVAQNFGFPVFNADYEVARLYKQNKNVFNKLRARLPKYIRSFPIEKTEIINAILANKNNLKKIVKIVHTEIKKKLDNFLKKNKNKEIVILDIPLLLENKLNKRKDILVFVQSKKLFITKNLKKRKNFNIKLFKKFKALQLPLSYKKKKSNFIIKNNFTKKSVNDGIKSILKEIR